MSDKPLKTEYIDKQEDSTYQTGSVQPPKSRMGIVFVLLCLVIVLGGIVTILSVTNIRLFQALYAQQQTESEAIGFSHGTSPAPANDAQQTGLGFCGETVSEFWHTYHQLPRGIFVQAVDENSDAARQGVLPGDIVTRLNGIAVTSLEDLQTLLDDHSGPVTVVLYRDSQQLTLQILPEPR